MTILYKNPGVVVTEQDGVITFSSVGWRKLLLAGGLLTCVGGLWCFSLIQEGVLNDFFKDSLGRYFILAVATTAIGLAALYGVFENLARKAVFDSRSRVMHYRGSTYPFLYIAGFRISRWPLEDREQYIPHLVVEVNGKTVTLASDQHQAPISRLAEYLNQKVVPAAANAEIYVSAEAPQGIRRVCLLFAGMLLFGFSYCFSKRARPAR